MRFAYADPPYLGCGARYAKLHPDAMVWDDPEIHRGLIDRLVADRIRQHRTDLGISTRTLAIRMRQQGHDWYHTTVQRTEAAKRPIRVAELAALAVALRTSMAALLDFQVEADALAEQHALGRKALADDLRDGLDNGEIPGSVIRWNGHEVWIHTTEQVDSWLRSRLEESPEPKGHQ